MTEKSFAESYVTSQDPFEYHVDINGDEVHVSIKAIDNPGMEAATIYINHSDDGACDFVEGVAGKVLSDAGVEPVIQLTGTFFVRCSFESVSNPVTQDGELFELTFKLKEEMVGEHYFLTHYRNIMHTMYQKNGSVVMTNDSEIPFSVQPTKEYITNVEPFEYKISVDENDVDVSIFAKDNPGMESATLYLNHSDDGACEFIEGSAGKL